MARVTGTRFDDVMTPVLGQFTMNGIVVPRPENKTTNQADEVFGLDGDDLIEGGDGPDDLFGGPGNDRLFGQAGWDDLDGGAGNDELHGGTGTDTLLGGGGADRLFGEEQPDHLFGGDGDDFLDGGDGKDNLNGGAGNDELHGGADSDVLIGRGDDDLLDGGGRRDRLFGGDGADILFGGGRGDRLYGGDGNDQLNGDDGVDRLFGEAGDDVLEGGRKPDLLFGGAGADRLLGGHAHDSLHGGADDDVLYGDGGRDQLFGDDGHDFLDGGEFGDLLHGGTGNDTLHGRGHKDHLFGDAGNDLLYGEYGADDLAGGSGNDALYGASGNDTLEGGAGDDLLDGGDGADLAIFAGDLNDYMITTANGVTTVVDLDPAVAGDDGTDTLREVELLEFGGEPLVLDIAALDVLSGLIIQGTDGPDNLTGSDLDDFIAGLAGADTVSGGGGGDFIDGSNGADSLFGGSGDDVLWGGAGRDEISGDDGNDRLSGGLGTDRLFGGFDDDTLHGGVGNDELYGDFGADDLHGDGGNDLLDGGFNEDNLQGGDGDDVLRGGFQGNDGLSGGAGDDDLFGGSDNDRLEGEAGADELFGEDGQDLLHGGAGGDLLDGGDGADTLGGGGGNDTLRGGEADDLLTGGAGDDSLDGGSGVDTALFAGDAAGYRITSAAGITTVEDLAPAVAGDDGTDQLVGIERIQFADGVVQIPPGIDLGALPPEQGAVLYGADAGDGAGNSVSSAGDVNGDGFDDIIIGARDASGPGNARTYSGESYVVFGSAAGIPAGLDLGTLTAASGFVIYGAEAGDGSGVQVSAAGDLNGDGFDDLVIGALRADGAGNAKPDAGESYVVFGSAPGSAGNVDLAALSPQQGLTILGADAGDSSGLAASDAGDVNGDRIDDIIIGAPVADSVGDARLGAGESYVIFGSTAGLPADIDLAALTPQQGFTIFGAEAGDYSGFSVSGAGDLNDDGLDDIVISAFGADGAGNAKPYAGESYVIFGSNAGLASDIDLAALTPAQGFTIYGAAAGDSLAQSVSSAGDVNGDGFDDLIVSAPFANAVGDQRPAAGESYVIFGTDGGFPAAIDLAALTPDQGFVIYGAEAIDLSGTSVSSAGDVNADGFDDLIVGAAGAAGRDNLEINAGESYLVFGRADFGASVDLAAVTPDEALIIFGADREDQSGLSVSSAGDVNADGFDDIVIGARGGDGAGNAESDAGEAYVIYGGNGGTSLAGRAVAAATLAGDLSDDTLSFDGASLAPADDFLL